MLNLTSLATITRHAKTLNSDTGEGVVTDTVVYDRVRCQLVPLGAKEREDRYGEDAAPVDTSRTMAALVLPSWVPVVSPLTEHTVTVDGDGPWRFEACQSVRDWTHYLVSRAT